MSTEGITLHEALRQNHLLCREIGELQFIVKTLTKALRDKGQDSDLLRDWEIQANETIPQVFERQQECIDIYHGTQNSHD